MVYFSDLLVVKHVNLISWLKVYVAFNNTVTAASPFLSEGGQRLAPNFENGAIRKKWVPGVGLKSFFQRYLLEGGRIGDYYFLSNETVKENMALRTTFQMLLLACFDQTTN